MKSFNLGLNSNYEILYFEVENVTYIKLCGQIITSEKFGVNVQFCKLMRWWNHELGLGEFSLICIWTWLRHARVNFLGRNARGLGLKGRKWFQFWALRLETQTQFWAIKVFLFISFYLKVLMWAWFFTLSGGLKWSGLRLLV